MIKEHMDAPRQRVVAVFTNGHEFTVRHREPLLTFLRDSGWSVTGVAPKGTDALGVFSALGFDVMPVELSRAGTNPLDELRSIRSIARGYHALRPTLTIHATIKPVVYGTLVASQLDVPVVNLITGLGFAYTGTTARATFTRSATSILYRLAFRYPRQRVIFQNHDDRDELMRRAGLRKDRCTVVPGSGVDVERFRPEIRSVGSSDTMIVVLPGRMLLDKGIEHFAEAAARLTPQYPGTRFVLVGPADEENPAGVSPTRLAELKERTGVEWWGSAEDMTDVYRQATLIVLPSRREGMPKVVLEAAACGIPVVTTLVPGCRESVEDGRSGFLVPFGDAATLANRIGTLLGNPQLRRDMGRQARALAERRFASTKIVRHITEQITELL
ncbi:MAG: glycosyltransferase family 4 protein [Rhodospirillaceae bacterium]